MKKLYKFFWDCGRQGHIEGVFVADESEVAKVIGKEVYFGEVLGKHSEVFGTLAEDEFKVITDGVDFVRDFEAFFPNGFGYNPLTYIEEAEEEE